MCCCNKYNSSNRNRPLNATINSNRPFFVCLRKGNNITQNRCQRLRRSPQANNFQVTSAKMEASKHQVQNKLSFQKLYIVNIIRILFFRFDSWIKCDIKISSS